MNRWERLIVSKYCLRKVLSSMTNTTLQGSDTWFSGSNSFMRSNTLSFYRENHGTHEMSHLLNDDGEHLLEILTLKIFPYPTNRIWLLIQSSWNITDYPTSFFKNYTESTYIVINNFVSLKNQGISNFCFYKTLFVQLNACLHFTFLGWYLSFYYATKENSEIQTSKWTRARKNSFKHGILFQV